MKKTLEKKKTRTRQEEWDNLSPEFKNLNPHLNPQFEGATNPQKKLKEEETFIMEKTPEKKRTFAQRFENVNQHFEDEGVKNPQKKLKEEEIKTFECKLCLDDCPVDQDIRKHIKTPLRR